MPEGDTLFRLAARLRPALDDQVLIRTEFRVPRFAELSLAGRRVSGVEARGKHLLIHVANTTIWSHLKMEGRWRVFTHDQTWSAPAHTARCVLATARHEIVGFSLGFLRVVPTAQVEHELSFLGPNPLRNWDEVQALTNLARQGDRAVGLALLDQTVIAGLGNVYRNEVCFLAGVHPDTPVSALDQDTLARIVGWSAKLLVLNSTRASRNTTGGVGGSPSFVYGRAGQACLRCRTRISGGTLGDPTLLNGWVGGDDLTPVERIIAWCPRCQPRVRPAE